MKRFQTVLCLLCLVCILLNISGCKSATSKHTAFSDPNSTVSFVVGLSKSTIGIVLNETEFLLSDSNGTVLCRKRFESRILKLDMRNKFCLFAFEDKHIELYMFENDEFTSVCNHSFDSDITKIELAKGGTDANDDVIVVLLSNGNLWRSESKSKKNNFVLMSDHVKTVVYEEFWRSIIYLAEDGELKGWSFDLSQFTSDIENEVLCEVTDLQNSYFDSTPCILAKSEDYCYYIGLDDNMKLSMIDKVPTDENTLIYVADTVPNSVIYYENGKYYYEGVSQSEQKEYRKHGKYGDRVLIDIPSGYSICAIKGGVVYYNDNEVVAELIN